MNYDQFRNYAKEWYELTRKHKVLKESIKRVLDSDDDVSKKLSKILDGC